MFHRKPLRDDVQIEIRQRIVDGRLPAGGRINETRLAGDLGLSRTPLREAMLTLAARGFLVSTMGRGFAVPELDPTTFGEIQEILRGLEPAALAMAGPPDPRSLMEMENLLNRSTLALVSGSNPRDRAETLAHLIPHFSAWALQHSPNRVMRVEIERLQALAARYWFAAALGSFSPEELLSSYRKLYDSLRAGHLDQACAHWADQTGRFATTVALGVKKAEG